MRAISALALAAALGLSGCAYDHHGRDGYRDGYYGSDYRYGNGYRGDHGYGRRHETRFRGPGAERLDPWLAHTPEGYKFVTDHYALGAGDYLSGEDAERANVFFRQWSDTDRDYRLTDEEIRTSLVHVRNGYGIGAY
ncbi:MAG: hypothetical protein ABR601_10435 [Parasphingopyxis sp.]|nr:hypothetical protein [Sphingomonadales bacterium]